MPRGRRGRGGPVSGLGGPPAPPVPLGPPPQRPPATDMEDAPPAPPGTSPAAVKLADRRMPGVGGGVARSGNPTSFGSQCSWPGPVAPCAGWRTTPDGKPSPSNSGSASDPPASEKGDSPPG